MSAGYISEGDAVPYTPVVNVLKGTVVVAGGFVGVVNLDSVANKQSSMIVRGMFSMPRETGAVFTTGASVYVDLVTQEATDNAGKQFVGYYVKDNPVSSAFVYFKLSEEVTGGGGGGGDMLGANNLSDVANAGTSRANLGIVALLGNDFDFGDGASTVFTIPHGLGTARLIPFVKEILSGDKVDVAVSIDATNVVIDFNGLSTPTANQYNVSLIGF